MRTVDSLLRRPGFWILLGFTAIYLLSQIVPYDVVGDVVPARASRGPDSAHWLGTDHLGRDVMWRLIYGSRAFFLPGLGTALGAVGLGALSGALAGYFGGFVATALRYVHTVIESVPSFVLALLACTIVGGRHPLAVLAAACAVSEAPLIGEAVWARIDAMRRQDFVLALKAHGIPGSRILVFHLLWVNLRGLLAARGLVSFGRLLVLEASLSYLGGFGVQEPTPSWGNMVAWELNVNDGNIWAWLAPALVLWLGFLGTVGLGQRRNPLLTAPVVRPLEAPASGGPDRLELRRLRVQVGDKTLVEEVNWSVAAGELVALVGPSGSGKSLTVRAALGLLPPGLAQTGGEVRLIHEGKTTKLATDTDFAAHRGSTLGLIDQDARASLDPTRTVGDQVAAAAALAGLPADAVPHLKLAGFSEPAKVARLHPHALSGGMAQRVAIALVLARGSRYLLADECTSGLDASLQQEVLEELRRLKRLGRGILLVTHDLRILPGLADRIVVVEGGRTVEEAATLQGLTGAGARLCEATRRIAGGAL